MVKSERTERTNLSLATALMFQHFVRQLLATVLTWLEISFHHLFQVTFQRGNCGKDDGTNGSLKGCIDMKNAEADAPSGKHASDSRRIATGAGDQTKAASNIFNGLTMTCKSYAKNCESEEGSKKLLALLEGSSSLDGCIGIKNAEADAPSGKQASSHQGVKMTSESSRSSRRDEKVQHFNFTLLASSISRSSTDGSCHEGTCTSPKVVAAGMVEGARVPSESVAGQATAAVICSLSLANTRTIDARLDLSTTSDDSYDTTLEDWSQDSGDTSTSGHHPDEDLESTREHSGSLVS